MQSVWVHPQRHSEQLVHEQIIRYLTWQATTKAGPKHATENGWVDVKTDGMHTVTLPKAHFIRVSFDILTVSRKNHESSIAITRPHVASIVAPSSAPQTARLTTRAVIAIVSPSVRAIGV